MEKEEPNNTQPQQHSSLPKSLSSSIRDFFSSHSPPSSPPKAGTSSFIRGHVRTPSVPIPAIKINSPGEDYSSDGDVTAPRIRKLGRSFSTHPDCELGPSSDISSIDEEPKISLVSDQHGSSGDSSSVEISTQLVNETEVGKGSNKSTTTSPRRKAKNILLYPWNDKKSSNNLAPPQRQRSKSYSDLCYNREDPTGEKGDGKLLPYLTLNEVKSILLKHEFVAESKGKVMLIPGSGSFSTETRTAATSTTTTTFSKSKIEQTTSTSSQLVYHQDDSQRRSSSQSQSHTGLLELSSALLPAASLASLDSRMMGMKHLPVISGGTILGDELSSSKSSLGINVHSTLPSSSSISFNANKFGRSGGGRPRLLSQPAFLIPDSIHTAPIMTGGGTNNQSGAMKFFLPYFRRASQVSTQGLILAESMVSLTNRALVSFIVEDNFTGLQHLLESRRVVVDDRDESGCTALMIAAARGKANFVRTLLEHGADINSEDGDNWTALLFATKEGHDEIVADLLDHGATVDHRDMGGWTALMWACYKGRTKAARLLIEKGADVNAYGNYSVTCLGWAAGRGHTEIVKNLLQRGAKVNTGDKYGTTPLIWAARKGYIEIVDMLLNTEAAVDACGMTSWTPLLVASAGNHVEVVKAILEHKPNVNALDKDGCSALTIACKEGFHEISVSLINHGAYININDRGGTSNLIHAAKGGHRSIVEALLKKHADVNVQGKDRKTALYWAVEKSHVPVVKMLLASQPDLELSTKDGDSPLMKAVRNRNVEIVSLLLDKRAKVSVADKNGDTCLHVAMRARSKQIVELLLRNPAHSQLLYRPNRAGETPYNIDRASPKPIIPQIFGSRGLNTQEDGENLLGYNLYSSALADMLSDPTLNMPITVGLFARWGSGKSFLLSKLREEMKSFARQWLNPLFNMNILIFIVIFCFSTIVGVVAGLAIQNWIVGVSFFGGVVIVTHTVLLCIWISSRRSKYDWSWSNKMSSYLAKKSEALKLVCQVIFCHPPGSQSADQLQAQPINFYFTDQTKISSTTGGENSVVQMLGSLYTCIENDYGVVSSRLYRAFKPKPVAATADWKWRKLCCIPYCVIFLLCLYSSLTAVVALCLYLTGARPKEHDLTLSIIMYSCALIVGLLLVANIYTVGQVMKAVVFSHRRHLQRTVSKLYAVKAEGFLNALKAEVNLMTDMIHCLDAFTSRQTRMVVIVDGLDSAEQEKVLQVLDAVHILFSDAKAPFIILLAIDPHIISKALSSQLSGKGIEMNINPVLNESNIGGQDYLRNLVHLPFFLQNAALRKVKHVKMLENSMKRNSRLEDDPGPQIILSTRRPSVESGFGIPLGLDSKYDKSVGKKPKRLGLGLKMSESVASSLGSNLNKVTSGMPIIGGPSDLKKMLLGDDYFSDVNPRSMRRLMNIIHITGRLLKCFSIEFNWYHLSAWVNVTEQWPYRLSWMIIYCEHFQKDLDDGMSLKNIYERVRPFIPTSKDIDANVSLDRDEKKLDIYLGMHKGSLLVSTLYVFLPFTISLDPQLRKDITEQYQPVDSMFKSTSNLIPSVLPPAGQPNSFLPNPFGTTSQQLNSNAQSLRYRGVPSRPSGSTQSIQPNALPPAFFHPGYPQNFMNPNLGNMWFGQNGMTFPGSQFHGVVPALEMSTGIIDSSLVKELKNKKLSLLNVEGICDLLVALTGIKSSQVTRYQEVVRKNNINGRVLLSCDLSELKLVMQMTFGDWETFKAAIMILRDSENKPHVLEKAGDDNANNNNNKETVRISVTSPGSPSPSPNEMSKPTGVTKSPGDAPDSKKQQNQQQQQQLRPNVLEKQVTMEDQMICGALELLNDEAKEDARKGEESSSTLSPINSEPEPPNKSSLEHRKSSKAYLPQDETDVLYVMGSSLHVTAELPDSPSVVRKLEEAEAKYMIMLNESQPTQQHIPHVRSMVSTSAVSDPISIPRTGNATSPGRRQMRPSSLSRNATHTGNVTFTSPVKSSRSLGAKDYQPQAYRSGRNIQSPGKEGGSRILGFRKQQSSQQHQTQECSSDASSDESQKPLVMKPLAGDSSKHSRKTTTMSRSARPPSDPTSSPKKKRGTRDESIASKFSRIKSNFFGQSPDQHQNSFPLQQQPVSSTYHQQTQQGQSSSQRRRHEYRPVRYDLPTEDSSEPSQYFKDHGHPWTAYRAPTPLPPFGTDEYYQVIKSSNPSPTTSNESEIGSTPEEISSREDLFLPGPPDLPESPYPRRSNVATTAEVQVHNEIPSTSSSFVPIQAIDMRNLPTPSSSKSKSSSKTRRSFKGRTVASSGEEAVGHSSRKRLIKSSMNQSDPVLSTSSTRVDELSQFTLDSSQIPVTNSSGGIESQVMGSLATDVNQMSPPRIGSPPLTRQSAVVSDEVTSKKENTQP